jgi:dTMP kinase
MLSEAMKAAEIEHVLAKDPGGTEIGDRIRHVLFDYDLSQMDVRCETLLFMASRAQLLRDVVNPALSSGRAVLCDRFVSATCAYQGAAGYDPKRVIELARFAIDQSWPNLTLLLDLAPEAGFERTGRKPKAKPRHNDVQGQVRLFHDTHSDAMERRPIEFHQQVRNMFVDLPAYYPTPVVIIDATAGPEEVHRRILEAITLATL